MTRPPAGRPWEGRVGLANPATHTWPMYSKDADVR